ncbi:TrkH family potassium uptake protein [Palleronia abyssalis]|uniref:Ktr system potassium uptake protein B n=1 Tax=Palleronia abyssalis TaxID=1501240 RepID=A0A2R8BSS3_9RHOB|nr:TrkH family potassium uptake protein [Palleronia abyssalis]SPJ23237.1 Ktr system potassium uptake protein B [Palleronia abyssalis]
MKFGDWLKRLPPPGMLAVIYLAFIALGSVALKLPIAQVGHITWSDAIFTSTSAVTVTGLIVVDTPEAFTVFGEAVLIVLMQMGGLGLMTFAALLLSSLGIPIGIPQRIVLQTDLNQTSITNLISLVRIILRLALALEAIAAVLLSFVFVPEFGWAQGLWHAVFHAVSAFNNAGFSTFSNSLMDYAANPLVTFTVCALFITSGLGFIVLAEVRSVRRWRKLSLHSKLMLAGTPVLIVLAFLGFAALEWSNPETLGAIDGTFGKLQAAFFQGTTPRTAGFNTVDTTAIRDSTALMIIGLMFIGGGSTSTAGGIKLTTFVVLVMATLAFFKRKRELNAFGRALGPDEIQKVMALMTISTLIIFSGVFILVIGNDGTFLTLLFEVMSAFGTVGLSMGATETLEGWGRGTIIVIMFLGRVGPLVLGFFLATQRIALVRYPKGHVYLG